MVKNGDKCATRHFVDVIWVFMVGGFDPYSTMASPIPSGLLLHFIGMCNSLPRCFIQNNFIN
jgi:hypothetical protein